MMIGSRFFLSFFLLFGLIPQLSVSGKVRRHQRLRITGSHFQHPYTSLLDFVQSVGKSPGSLVSINKTLDVSYQMIKRCNNWQVSPLRGESSTIRASSIRRRDTRCCSRTSARITTWTWRWRRLYRTIPSLHRSVSSTLLYTSLHWRTAPSTRKSSLIFAVTRCQQQNGFPKNPSDSDIVFAFAFAQCKCILNFSFLNS